LLIIIIFMYNVSCITLLFPNPSFRAHWPGCTYKVRVYSHLSEQEDTHSMCMDGGRERNEKLI